jgi:hypothetical protein
MKTNLIGIDQATWWSNWPTQNLGTIYIRPDMVEFIVDAFVDSADPEPEGTIIKVGDDWIWTRNDAHFVHLQINQCRQIPLGAEEELVGIADRIGKQQVLKIVTELEDWDEPH